MKTYITIEQFRINSQYFLIAKQSVFTASSLSKFGRKFVPETKIRKSYDMVCAVCYKLLNVYKQ